ncbi:hypothetical protein EXIGLDRAFT_148688 [Exidia glandulosa HHB12029]|uniref:Uncharacterized protein n=1 Tax=Exidia glandulosa HHB12029 TaxID=1314781 RepID=A0A165FNV3_EXIGL|nr:hypothetical protein EXIGLDRAFT_148688 [Exidia glandulosa HHB12029]
MADLVGGVLPLIGQLFRWARKIRDGPQLQDDALEELERAIHDARIAVDNPKLARYAMPETINALRRSIHEAEAWRDGVNRRPKWKRVRKRFFSGTDVKRATDLRTMVDITRDRIETEARHYELVYVLRGDTSLSKFIVACFLVVGQPALIPSSE